MISTNLEACNPFNWQWICYNLLEYAMTFNVRSVCMLARCIHVKLINAISEPILNVKVEGRLWKGAYVWSPHSLMGYQNFNANNVVLTACIALQCFQVRIYLWMAVLFIIIILFFITNKTQTENLMNRNLTPPRRKWPPPLSILFK